MAKVQTYTPRDFQADSVRPAIPAASTVWQDIANKSLSVAEDIGEKQAVEQGFDDQLAAGTSRLVESPKLFGVIPTRQSELHERAATAAFSSLKRTELETKLGDLRTRYERDPETFKQRLGELRSEFLTAIPVNLMPQFTMYFNEEATRATRAVDVFARQQEHERNKGILADRLDILGRDLGNLFLAPVRDEAAIDAKAAEYRAHLEQMMTPSRDGTSVFDPVNAVRYRAKLIETIGLADVTRRFDNAKSVEERQALIKELEEGRYSVPRTGEGKVLLAEGHETLDPQTALRLAGSLQVQLRQSEQADKATLALLKLELGEATRYQDSSLQEHPDAKKLIEQATALGRPDLLDDIRKATISTAQVGHLRAFALLPSDQQAIEVQTLAHALTEGKSKDPFATQEFITKANAVMESRRKAEESGTLAQWLAARGLGPVAPEIDWRNPTSADAVRASRVQVEAASSRSQLIVSDKALKEAKDIFDNGQLDEQVTMLRTLARLPRDGRERTRMISEVGARSPELALLADMVGDPARADLGVKALTGINYARRNAVQIQDNGNLRKAINDGVAAFMPKDADGRPIDPDGRRTAAARSIVLGLYVQNQLAAGRLTADDKQFDSAAVTSAILEFVGAAPEDIEDGNLPMINGKAVIPFERGMSADRIELLWSSQNDEIVKVLNGGALPQDIPGAQGVRLGANEIIDRGWLEFTGQPGRYYVAFQDRRTGKIRLLTTGRLVGGRAEPFVWDYAAAKDALNAAVGAVRELPSVPEGAP